MTEQELILKLIAELARVNESLARIATQLERAQSHD
jgi:hypothetical protein